MMQVSKLQVVLVTIIATVLVSVGETLLSVGMKQANQAGREGLKIVLAAATNPFVICGVALMASFFVLYSLALSWADISFVLPLTALSYLFVALMAAFILNEPVTPARWVGTLLIVVGVVIVGFGERN